MRGPAEIVELPQRAARGHVPVLLDEVLAALAPRDGATYVDGTFGGGGYARALLDAAACTVWGLDRDPDAIARGADMMRAYPGRLTVVKGCFGDMDKVLGDRGVAAVDGVALDIGVSSYQINEAERGFSFQADGPLDMRMDTASDGPTAADLVNQLGEAELADLIYAYGEERASRRIARAIVQRRATAPFQRTGELAETIRAVMPRAPRKKKGPHIDPATRSFQALRIYVNDEINELRHGLSAAERLLAPGGRLAVVCFHSLEDRETKAFLSERSGATPRGSRHLPDLPDADIRPPSFRLLYRRPIQPGAGECASNPRARSARLRGAERTDAAAWPEASSKTGGRS